MLRKNAKTTDISENKKVHYNCTNHMMTISDIRGQIAVPEEQMILQWSQKSTLVTTSTILMASQWSQNEH